MTLWLRYCGIILRSQMQYKVSFFFTALGQLIVSFSMFAGIYFMFLRFHHVEGYGLSEVLLCFSAVLMAYALAECFFRGFDAFSQIISNMEFDRIMLRPRPIMLQVLGSRMEFSRIGRLLQAIVMFCYAIPASPVLWTADKVLVLGLMVLGGVGLFAGVFIIRAGVCFFTIEGLEFMNIFADGSRELGKYPLSIYGEGVLKFCTYVVPLACVQYYPLLYLLGKTQNVWAMLAPMAGIAFLLPAYGFWCFGVGRYKSTGS